MKTKIYFVAMMAFGMMAFNSLQAQNQECMTNLSIYVEHAKVKNYDAAYTPWKMVYDNCPELHYATYAYGEKILNHKIDNSSGAEKDGFINDFIKLSNDFIKYFPKKAKLADVIVDQVMIKYENKMISDDEIYSELGRALKEDRANFKNPKAIYLYFSSLVDLHGAGKKELQEVFDVYDDVSIKIEEENKKLTDNIAKLLPKEEDGTITSKEKRVLKVATTNSESFGKIAGSVDSKLGTLADCENLIPLYEKSFEQNKGDVAWVKKAVGMMFSKECTDDPMFSKLVEIQAQLDPSADVYVYLGTLKMKNGDTSGALADFDKALSLETDNYKRSKIAYKVAAINKRKGSKSNARKYALKAIDYNGSNGRAYLLIANLYASSANECGSKTFDKLAMYWKAAEMASKAGRVDPSLSGTANKTAAAYNAKAPTKSMIFSEAMAGKTVTFNCWVGGSVKVPNIK